MFGQVILSVVLGGLLGLGLFLLLPRRTSAGEKLEANKSAKQSPISKLNALIERCAAHLHVSPALFVMLSCVSAVLGAGLAIAFTGVPSFAVVSAIFSLLLLGMLARSAERRQHRRAVHLWSDVIDNLASAIRSGAGIPQAISGLAANPLRLISSGATEFEVDFEVTGNFDRCLDRLKVNWHDSYADRIIETLRIAREVGSRETVAILTALATHMRQDIALRQEIDARQGWIRLAAKIGVAAPWLVLTILSTQETARQAFATSSGTIIILVGIVATCIAYALMNRLGRLATEQRWLS